VPPGEIDSLISTTDGGGIRGYWSLLALKNLMEYVAEREAEPDENDESHHHSFSPQAWPENVSQIPRTEEHEFNEVENAHTPEAKCLAMSKARRFLPCHYFDHICGSSTGA